MNSGNNKIDLLEQPGLYAFQTFCDSNSNIKDYWFTSGKKGLDCIVQTKDYAYYGVEIKTRSKLYDTFFLEQTKKEVFDRRYKKVSYIDLNRPIYYSDILYVNNYADKLYIYTFSYILTKINRNEYIPVQRWMNYKTYNSNTKTSKIVYELPVSDAYTFVL